MNLDDYPNAGGKKVWLFQEEVDRLLEIVDDAITDVALRLAVRCGSHTEVIVTVRFEDIAETDAGRMLRIWEGAKTGEYRETPIPDSLANTIATIEDVRDADSDSPIIDISKRTLRRRISDATERLQEETGDPGWRFVGFHDLRRTRATQLRSADVNAMVVLYWSG